MKRENEMIRARRVERLQAMRMEPDRHERASVLRERMGAAALVSVLLISTGVLLFGSISGANAAKRATGAGTVVSANSDVKTMKTTQSEYITSVFDKHAIMSIDIKIPQSYWDSLIRNASSEEFKPCDITVNGKTITMAGIRTKGNASLRSTTQTGTGRYGFKVDFAEYVDGQTLDGLRKMALNNLAGDATYMKEYLSYEIFASIGVATPAYAYAQISVNGKPWGLYIANEAVEESFIERTYGNADGNLYKPESMKMDGAPAGAAGMEGPDDGGPPPGLQPAGDRPDGPAAGEGEIFPQDAPGGMEKGIPGGMKEGAPGGMRGGVQGAAPGKRGNSGTSLVYSDDSLDSYSGIFNTAVFKETDDADKQRVIAMMKALSTGEAIDSHVDVDQVLRYFAANTFMMNMDSYAGPFKHNYYLYEEDGLFDILPWDLHLSFGGFQLGEASKAINFPIDAPVTDTMENSPLISALLAIPEYKARYHGFLQTLLDDFIDNGTCLNVIDQVDALLSDAVSSEPRPFYTKDQYAAAVAELKTFCADRSKSVHAQLDGTQPADSYGNIPTGLNLAAMGTLGRGPK